MLLVPFISAALYLIGGQWWKPARWLMGVPISLIALVSGYNLYSLLCILTYWIATSAFPYGEKSWLNWAGEYGKFAICGCAFGLASLPILWGYLGLINVLVSTIGFLVLKYLDDKGIVKNPFQELLRGFIGTIMYVPLVFIKL